MGTDIDLPWSTCATMAKLRVRDIGIDWYFSNRTLMPGGMTPPSPSSTAFADSHRNDNCAAIVGRRQVAAQATKRGRNIARLQRCKFAERMRVAVLALAAALSAVCAWPCDWPVIHSSGRIAHAQTRYAQRLLNVVMHANLTVDGDFGAATTSTVEAFERAAGLTATGYLDNVSWPVLITKVGGLRVGAASEAVAAVQDALGVAGFAVPVTGRFDTATTAALSRFQASRHADVQDGLQVDDNTWHLLVSGCNSSMDTAAYFFDVGWYRDTFAQHPTRHAPFSPLQQYSDTSTRCECLYLACVWRVWWAALQAAGQLFGDYTAVPARCRVPIRNL